MSWASGRWGHAEGEIQPTSLTRLVVCLPPQPQMIWLKGALAGLVAAIVTVVAIVVATATFFMSAGEGSGGISVVYFGLSVLLLFPAALAFALGFRWMVRRQRRRMAK